MTTHCTIGNLGTKSLKANKVNNRWSHTVLSRAIIAYYQVCKDNKIIERLVNHYKTKDSSHTLLRMKIFPNIKQIH